MSGNDVPAKIFATARQVQQGPTSGRNHGLTWTSDTKLELRRNFECGDSLSTLCHEFGRSAESIVAKLASMGLIYQPDWTTDYYVTHKENAMYETPEPPTPTVDAPVIETKVMIQGRDAARMTDDEIFTLIANLENECDALKRINNKPKKLSQKINGIQADIGKLIEYVDGR